LLIWLLGPLLLLCIVLLLDSYRGARVLADRAYDTLIAASAYAIADRVVPIENSLDLDLPYVALEMLSTPAQDRVFYRVAGPGGTFVTGYRDLPLPPDGHLPAGPDPVFYDAHYRGEALRITLLTRPVRGRYLGGRYSVQVAQTRGERDDLAYGLAVATAFRFLALTLLVAFVTWFGVRFGLQPLAHLRREVRRRSPQDLRPLQVDVPREVIDLVLAIDSLMARLDHNLRSMERFVSDAAHQLRGPLAALHTRVELLLRESEPASLRRGVTELRALTWRTSRLARQLLVDARASSESTVGGARRARFDLAHLAAETTRSQVPAALVKQIDLGFEGSEPVHIVADPVLLEELLKNLIDNAIRYCPETATVTVRVRRETAVGQGVLEIEDNGPGIPAVERERVFERFYRLGGQSEEGSGLGLAIVREVAGANAGQASLHTPATGGLLVRVTFPLSP
jgi:two-component system sensor histidine kinase TctE